MSGRTKRILYAATDVLLYAAAWAGAVTLAVLAALGKTFDRGIVLACCGFLLAVILQLPAILHEAGHLLFGACAGMKFHAVTVWRFRITKRGVRFISQADVRAAGDAEMFPRSGKRVRARLVAFGMGGSVLDLGAGAAGLALYLCLPYHPALLFFAMISALFLYEGLRALLPANLPAGKTDGEAVFGLLCRRDEEEIMLRVAAAQGILFRGGFEKIPRETLFDAPVVREDLPAWQSLQLLRAQYLLFCGEEEEARAAIERLFAADGLSDRARREAERYLGYFDGNFTAEKGEEFCGVRALEERLEEAAKTKKSAEGQI